MILIADNLTVTNSAIAKAISDMDPGPIQDLVFQCERAGAEAIDINPGPLTKDPEEKMTFLVAAVQSVCGLPLLLDTINHKALEAGLRVSLNPVIINGFSLEPKKLEFILPLAKQYDADIIGYLLYPNGHVPAGEDDLTQIALDLYGEFKKKGMDDNRLIIDPVVAPLMWENGMRHNRNILSLIQNLPDLFGFPVRTIAGLSNLTSGPGPSGKKRLAEQTFIPMLASAGLTYGLLNVLLPETLRTARMSHMLLNTDVFSWVAAP
jgi:5-methyltetrahydrofolate corrinoid/iron sulfur protein methyltransferase